jgi:gp16 family phage-associated protein
MNGTKTKAHVKAREKFSRTGLSISDWAQQHGFNRSLVYEVLAGRKKCHRGDSHRIAVMLGIKQGELLPRNGGMQ